MAQGDLAWTGACCTLNTALDRTRFLRSILGETTPLRSARLHSSIVFDVVRAKRNVDRSSARRVLGAAHLLVAAARLGNQVSGVRLRDASWIDDGTLMSSPGQAGARAQTRNGDSLGSAHLRKHASAERAGLPVQQVFAWRVIAMNAN